MGDASSVPPMGDHNMNPQMDAPQMNEPELPSPDMEGGNEGGDDTVSLFNKLNDDDKEAARSYIKSMLDKSAEDDESNDEEMPDMDGEQPMMETVIFSKKQISKLNEVFGVEDEKEDKPLDKKMDKPKKKSPFNAPKFK